MIEQEILALSAYHRAHPPRQTSAVALVLAFALVTMASGAPTPLRAQAAVAVANTDCVALNDPHNCCTGSGTGDCDNKFGWSPIKKAHQFSEFCASFWFDITCDDERDGVQWLVSANVCTQAEADAGDPLPTITCNETRAEEGYCRSNLGCVGNNDPWVCCDGLDSGTCPFTGSSSTPQVLGCRRAFDDEMLRLWKALRRSGQLKWKAQDAAPFVPDDSPVN